MSTPLLPWDDVPEAVPSPSPPAPRGDVSVCLHGSAVARLTAVADHVRACAGRDLRLVAPTHDQATDVARTVLADQRATVGVERAGWVGLALRLATPALMADGLVPVSSLGLHALVARVVARARSDGTLAWLASASRHPGFVPALTQTLSDVRLAGLPPSALDDGSPRGRDLAALAHDLDAALDDARHADRATVLRLAAAAVTGSSWATPLVLVDPPITSRLDARLAHALLSCSGAPLIVAPMGDVWITRLLDGLSVVHVAGVAAGRPAADALARVHEALFASGDRPAPPSAGDESVVCLSAPGEGREAVEIVRELLAHAERGVPFDRMAIVTRAPELYASHLETALSRAGVPAYFGRGTRRPDPAGRALLALLTCVVEQFSARRFAEYLSLGQVPGPVRASSTPAPARVVRPDEAEALGLRVDDADESADQSGDTAAEATIDRADTPPRSPWRWEAILNDAQVIAGADRWRERLAGHRAHLLLRADGARKDDASSARADGLQRRAEWTSELAAFVHDVLVRPIGVEPDGDRWLEDWPARDGWRGWLSRLRGLAARALVDASRVRATLAELEPLAGIEDVSLAEVVDVLRDRLTHLPATAPPHRYGRVFVGTPDQVRGRVFDVVCVPGLAERVFPQRSRQDPLLLDQTRLAISADLAVDEDRVATERLQLRLAVGAARRVLVASYASIETTQARPRVPSFYAIDLQRSVTGHLPGYEALIRSAQARSGARLAWPAPVDPIRAIDAAEHDLSALQRYLHGSDTDIEGRARYLFDLNPALRRSLVARHQRLSRAWTPHDGLVAGPGGLASHRLAARPYSASALQRFATCPYQFYLSTILRLEPREDAAPLTTLDPLTRGSMVHAMLAATMAEYIRRGWTPPGPTHLDEAQTIADRVALDVAAEKARELVPPIQRVWDDAIAAIRRDLREWVRRLTREDGAWAAVHVEFGIGFPGGFGVDAASVPAPAALPDGSLLHGYVDLIERGADGTFRITDYKTGRHRLSNRAVVNGGRTLQPLLYAMAVEAALGVTVSASRLYYCTEDGDFTDHPWAITGPDGEHGRREGLNVMAIVDRAIEFGQLPAAPAEDACRWCDFRAVCGPLAQQVPGRKDTRALGDLQELRRWR